MEPTTKYMHYEDMFIYGFLEHVQTQRDKANMSYHVEQNEETRKAIGNYRIITTTRGLCNDLFYDQITRPGNIHNGFIKLSKNNQVIGFKFHDSIMIDESESYNDIIMTMDTLNIDIAKEPEKYKYTGQSLH